MNFGIIGLGHIAIKFAETLEKMDECLYAVASRDISKAIKFSEEYNSIKYYGSYEELYNDPNVDIIYIATPNSYHYINAHEALIHNKHVICEKPFTTNPSDAKKLYDLAKDKKLFIMEALWPEFFPSTKKLKEIIESGIIGEIKTIKAYYGTDTTDERKKRLFDPSLGGGALLDVGIYTLGFVDMIINKDVKSFKSEYRLNKYGTDEYSKINLYYDNNINIEVIETLTEVINREAFIEGTKGSIFIPNFHQNEKIIVKTDKEEIYNFPFEINGFEYQIKEAIKCIKEGKSESSIYPHKASIRLMKLLYDIRMSWNMKFPFE